MHVQLDADRLDESEILCSFPMGHLQSFPIAQHRDHLLLSPGTVCQVEDFWNVLSQKPHLTKQPR